MSPREKYKKTTDAMSLLPQRTPRANVSRLRQERGQKVFFLKKEKNRRIVIFFKKISFWYLVPRGGSPPRANE